MKFLRVVVMIAAVAPGISWALLDPTSSMNNLRGKAYCQFCDVRNVSLVGEDLRGKHLNQSAFDGADLSRANLQGSTTKADQESVKQSASFTQTNFTGANLKYVQFASSDFTGAKFDHADLESATLAWSKCIGASFKGADLTRTDLSHANCTKAIFTGAVFTGTVAEGADFTGADFQGADLSKIGNWNRANLRGANLRNAILPADPEAMRWVSFYSTTMPNGRLMTSAPSK
jgi:uncharacterized protein YjbI with pentapeptide repeats